ncbi:NADP-dependent oxidoreductase domain-containing protein [Mycena alexandri]|uniref:NADP-dependent oxidoreductase domain-containing protein n=1 Tax=Mycena alexandri TaxID=1745969 RepID=A0AAD6T164_9AGAR|nr:NADP-dependent oxidoreductase domain-containing protein [Mycena alexandri]
MPTPISNVGVVFGAMTVGEPGHGPGRHFLTVTTHEASIELFDIFQKHGHSEVDTARIYGGGSSEEHLGAIGWQERGLKVDTKLYPTKDKGMSFIYADEVTHSPADLRKGLKDSLNALKTDKINTFYLHIPDRATPFEDTLREVNKIYTEGIFERFGLSNFQSWEVARVCEICRHNGWVMPTVYQGAYNAQHRAIEAELVPCLRAYGISLYAFNPLAAGFLTSAYTRDKAEFDTGDRFDPSQPAGKYLRARYWHEPNFKALDLLRPEIAKHGITESEAAFRWLAHHSVLKKELGDAVILGASSPKHLEENLAALDKGPLPEEVVQALEGGWEHTRVFSLKYWS